MGGLCGLVQRQDRDKLITEHLALVEPIAQKLSRRLPPSFDLDDLVQAGSIGLIRAAERWNPERGVPFGAYARMGIRGAMLDSIRRQAWFNSTMEELKLE